MGNDESRMKQHIAENNMSNDMATNLVKIVNTAYTKHKGLQNSASFGQYPDVGYSYNCQGIMDDVTNAICQIYDNIEWHCLAGPDVTYGKMPRPKYFIRFDIDRTTGADMLAGKKDFIRVFVYGK